MSAPRSGSSPLTRGKPATYQVTAKLGGLIPAHAGKTTAPPAWGGRGPAHPRSRGENVGIVRFVGWGGGSSPLTRGKPPVQERSRHAGGLIPAHAGKTLIASCSPAPIRAHPRSRGENFARVPVGKTCAGSSPLTRGKLDHACGHGGGQGLIPAHAGKTLLKNGTVTQHGAHPRSRGENE